LRFGGQLGTKACWLLATTLPTARRGGASSRMASCGFGWF
jgi:hypothetical protein